MGAQRATIETLVEAMGEEAGLSFAYQKYFGDKYSYEDFKAAYDRLSQNIKEFTELKEMEYAAITHHEDVEYQHDVKSNFACCAFRKSAAVAFRFADQSFLC